MDDWSSSEMKQHIVVPQVDAIAVYRNPDGDVVVRQRNSTGEDDAVIFVPPSAVAALVKALKEAAKA